ncbi:MAG TPA: glycosyltransferase [Anaerolineae bacterium]|nr:glycosyltransferase [Anaerolineae bacterium]
MANIRPLLGNGGEVGERMLRILQVSTADIAGGAEKVAWNLFRTYRARGYDTWLAVGIKRTDDPNVIVIPSHDGSSRWARSWWSVYTHLRPLAGRVRGAWWLSRLARAAADPRRLVPASRGLEDFAFPGTRRLLELPGQPPDIVHCHNLHGGYFDLRTLPWLSARVPVILTLHDAWLLSGHCALPFDCERWKTGCGHCPDLTIYPAVRRDATAYNWERKRDIYAKSRLYVATASTWLMEKVTQSILAPGVVEARLIPNSVDLSVFRPADRRAARAELAIPQEGAVLLFAAHGVRHNIWKDYHMMRTAVAMAATRLRGQKLFFIGLGDDTSPTQIGQVDVRFVPFQNDPATVAAYYRAADVYLHAARAETWGLTITEALACGTPVVATAVGGIPEQVKGYRMSDAGLADSDLNRYNADEATGLLVPAGDADSMARGIECLLNNELLRRQLGANAAADAGHRFSLQGQADRYLTWYREIADSWRIAAPKPQPPDL